MGQALLAVHDYGNSDHQNITNSFDSWQRVEVENHSNIIDFERDDLSIFGGDGLSMTVYRCDTTTPPPLVKDLFKIESAINERLLIVSTSFKTPTKGQIDNKQNAVINKPNDSSKPYKKPKRTKGRKKAVYATHFKHNDEWLEVNANENMGFYPRMMQAFIKQLDIAYSIHKRLLVVRFDLHQKDHYTEDSKMITGFFERAKRKLETHYNGLHAIGHIWVREQEKAKAQHYHCVLILDYDLVCNPKVTGDKVRETWGSLREGNTVHMVSGSHKVNDIATRANAIYHISYMAKERGKGYRPPQSKDYGTSRLKVNA